MNGTVRIASSTNPGKQNAVYVINGGSINSNVNLSLPSLNTGQDTIATLSANNIWTGNHTFTQGLTSSGPISTSATINSTSSITGSSVQSTGAMVASGDISALNNLNVNGTVNANGATTTIGTNLTATNGTTSLSTLNVSGLHTAAQINASGNINMANTGALTHLGAPANFTPNAFTYALGSGHILMRNDHGGTDADFFGIQTGTSKGMIIATSTTERIAFCNTASTVQNVGGSKSISGTYGTTEATALSEAYNALRNFGFLS